MVPPKSPADKKVHSQETIGQATELEGPEEACSTKVSSEEYNNKKVPELVAEHTTSLVDTEEPHCNTNQRQENGSKAPVLEVPEEACSTKVSSEEYNIKKVPELQQKNNTTNTNVATNQQEHTTNTEIKKNLQYNNSETTNSVGEQPKQKNKKIQQYFPVKSQVQRQQKTTSKAGNSKLNNKTTLAKNEKLEKMKVLMRQYTSPKTADCSLPNSAREGSSSSDRRLGESQMTSAWRQSNESSESNLAKPTNLV